MLKDLAQMLIDDNHLTVEQYKEALAVQKETGALLGMILIERGFITETILIKYLARLDISHKAELDPFK